MPSSTDTYHPVDRSSDERWRRRFRFAALVSLALATIIGLGVSVGALFGWTWLTAGPRGWGARPVPGPTLAGSLLTIAGLWLVLFTDGRYRGRGRFLLVLVVAAGVSWLAITFARVAVDPTDPQVPASSAAFGLAAVALAGFLVSLRRGAAAGQILAFMAGTVATVPLLGYAIGARSLAGFPFGFGAISVPTIAILLLASFTVAVARPDAGVIDVATARSPGGVVLRWFLVPVLTLPPVLIMAISAGESRPLRTLAWVGSALSAIAVIALVATARAIDRADESRQRATEERMALAVGFAQDTVLVGHVADSLGVVGSIPDRLSIGVRRAAALGMVGGDAYAVIGIGGERLAVVLIDIESKGAEPAALALRLRDSIVSALQAGPGPSRALESVAWLVADSDTVATAFVGVVHPGAGEFVYASAGHVPAIWRSREGLHLLEHTGPLLHGDVVPGWSETTCSIDPKDSIVVFSDGIADVVVRPEGGTTIEAFVGLIEQCPHRDPERIVSWCMERLETSSDWVLVDDATLIAVTLERRRRRRGRSGAVG